MTEQAERAEQAALDLLRGAVSIPSVSGDEGAVAAFLVDRMRHHGFAARVDEVGNAVGERGAGPLTVVLLGHIDTVPGEILVREEGGKLYGRGSVDAKGSFCAFVAAVAALSDDVLARARFVCVGAVEEEAPSSRGARHVMTRLAPDFVLIGEPSGADGVTLGYKGRLVARAVARKPNFHSAGDGTSAADDLAEFWFRARDFARAAGGEGPFSSVQATLQRLTSDSDGLEQVAEATIGLRLPPELSPETVEARLGELVGELPIFLSFTGHEHAVRHPRDNALTRALRTAIRGEELAPVFKLKTGTSDMNVVAPSWTVPTVAYGPGDAALDHTPNEHLDLAEYLSAVRVLRAALTRLAGA